MNNLLIPAAGKSSRFPNMKLKWLLTHPDGSLMIQKVVESFNITKYDRVIVTILKEHCEKYNADLILKEALKKDIKICILDNPTRDPSETIYKTIIKMKIKGLVTIKDSDCYVKADFPLHEEYVCGLNISKINNIADIQNKSFIIKNDENIIIDIVEKKIVSDIICLGVYCLEVENFLMAYEKIFNSPVCRFGNEVYISHVVSYLLAQKKIIHFVEADQFIDWGTLEDWYREQKKYSTFFFDIDGVFLHNTGRYGLQNWSNYFEPLEKNISILKTLSDSGAQIIFTTSRDEDNITKFKDLLKEREINYKQIITDCHHSQRIIVNDFATTNPYPSCRSVSIPRNQDLKPYLFPYVGSEEKGI